MRLVNAVLRQGHLSEQALVEALMTGERPAHLDRCEQCAGRAVELGRWLDDIRVLGQEAADEVFSNERLAAQHAQIMRKIEQTDEPPRVITFPAASVRDAREGTTRRVAPAWVGVAAAAGLVLGVVGGQVSARLTMEPVVLVQQVPAPASPAQPGEGAPIDVAENPSVVPISFDEDSLLTGPDVLRAIDDITPRMSAILPNSGG